MRYPDIKDIVDHIYHDYMTRCEIVIKQNKMIERSNGEIIAWCDECWLYDFAEDIKSAFDEGCFVDIDEDEVPKLEKEYGSENIIELVEDYFFHNKKILRITYHPKTPDIVDAKILNEEDGSLDIDRMINLPIEEHIKEIESLTEEQYQEFLSKLPLCNSQETPMHAIEVNYTMETDGVDAEEVIDNIGKKTGS